MPVRRVRGCRILFLRDAAISAQLDPGVVAASGYYFWPVGLASPRLTRLPVLQIRGTSILPLPPTVLNLLCQSIML
jgi:hypothetical protein